MTHKKTFLKIFLMTALFVFTLAGLGPKLMDEGMSSWPLRGDSKFYANSAANFLNSGHFTWNELYPIALKAGQGTEMAWSAIAHPMLIAALLKVTNWSEQKSAIGASVLAYIAMLVGFAAMGLFKTESWAGALLFSFIAALLSQSRDFATQGGTESLSIAFLVWSFFLITYFLKKTDTKRFLILLSFLLIASLTRPHNQFLLLCLPILYLFKGSYSTKYFFSGWLATLVVFWGLKTILEAQSGQNFSYLFSFLVGTPSHPGHELFREYVGGFGFSHLGQGADELPAKALRGWGLLKMYWTGWLPQAMVMIFCMCLKRPRALAILGLSLLSLSIFFSAMGHLVPRYWTMLEPLSLLVLLCSWCSYIKFDALKVKLMWVVSVTLLVLGLPFWGFSMKLSDARIEILPVEILNAIPKGGWLATDHPARVIDSINNPLLLCPKNLEVLQKIEREVSPVKAILFTPELSKGELKEWANRDEELIKLGYRVVTSGFWKLYIRSDK